METREEQFYKFINDAKDTVNNKYLASFINSSTSEEREEIHAKITVLKDVIFAIKNEYRGN